METSTGARLVRYTHTPTSPASVPAIFRASLRAIKNLRWGAVVGIAVEGAREAAHRDHRRRAPAVHQMRGGFARAAARSRRVFAPHRATLRLRDEPGFLRT